MLTLQLNHSFVLSFSFHHSGVFEPQRQRNIRMPPTNIAAAGVISVLRKSERQQKGIQQHQLMTIPHHLH